MTVLRKAALATGVAAAITAAGLVAYAASDDNDTAYGKLERHALHWDKRIQTTSSDQWATLMPIDRVIPGRLTVTNRGPVTLAFSGDFSGAPVEIRGVQSGRVMEPGRAHFDPSSGTTSFAFNFVRTKGNGHVSCRTYWVEWRSPTGEEVIFNRGDVVVNYRHDDTTKSGLRIGCG